MEKMILAIVFFCSIFAKAQVAVQSGTKPNANVTPTLSANKPNAQSSAQIYIDDGYPAYSVEIPSYKPNTSLSLEDAKLNAVSEVDKYIKNFFNTLNKTHGVKNDAEFTEQTSLAFKNAISSAANFEELNQIIKQGSLRALLIRRVILLVEIQANQKIDSLLKKSEQTQISIEARLLEINKKTNAPKNLVFSLPKTSYEYVSLIALIFALGSLVVVLVRR